MVIKHSREQHVPDKTFPATGELSALNAMLHAIASVPELPRMVEILSAQLATLMDLEGLTLALVNERGEIRESIRVPATASPGDDVLMVLPDARRATRIVDAPSLVATPIIVDDTLLGIIAARAGRPAAYTARHGDLLEHLALALGLALRARQLEATNRRRAQQLEAMERLAGRLNRLQSPRQIASALAAETGSVVPHNSCHVYLSEGGELFPAAGAGLAADGAFGPDRAALDVMGETNPRATVIPSAGGGATLAVPLHHESVSVGMLLLARQGASFDTEEVQLIDSLAAHAATSISDAVAHQELQRRVRELENLQRAVAIVGANLDRATTIERIVTALAGVAGYRMIGMYTRDGDELVLQAQVGYHNFIDRLPMGQGVMSRCVREGRSILLEDVRSDPDYIAAMHDIRSEVAVPVFLDGQAVGVLNVESGPERKLGAWDLALVELFSQQVSVALANVSRFEQAVERATIDWVSQLPNHGALMEQLAAAARQADDEGEPLSLLFIDLDHFKAINDAHGHRFGDSVLAAVGRLLTRWTPEHAWPARYGGEEFVVLLPDTDAQAAATVARTIQRAVSEHEIRTPAGDLARLTVSIGVATREPGERLIRTPEELLESADRAMYAAKFGGRDRIMRWSRELDEPEALAS